MKGKFLNIVATLCITILLSACAKTCNTEGAENPNEAASCECFNINQSFTVNPLGDAFKIPAPGSSALVLGATDPSGNPLPLPGGVGPVLWVAQTMEAAMSAGAEKIYKGLVGAGGFGIIIKSTIVLSIMLYGATIAFGMTQANAYAAVLFIVKVLFVYYFATNWELFYDFFVVPVESLVQFLAGVMINAFTGAAVGSSITAPFEEVDKVLQMFLVGSYWKVIIACILEGGVGLLYAAVLLVIIYKYTLGVFQCIGVYLIAMIARHLLYAIAPIYFMFFLFNKTKSLFDSWIQQLFNWSLQPIFLFAFFGMFNTMITSFFANISTTVEQICYRTWEAIPFLNFNVWQFGGSVTSDSVPLSIWSLLSLSILCWLMGDMALWVRDVAGRITGGLITASPSAIAGWNEIKNAAKGYAAEKGKQAGNSAGRLLRRTPLIGANAQERREVGRAQTEANQMNRDRDQVQGNQMNRDRDQGQANQMNDTRDRVMENLRASRNARNSNSDDNRNT